MTALRGARALILAVALLVAGCVRQGDPDLYPPQASDEPVEVYVAYNWIHANIVAPRDRLAAGDGPTARAVAFAADEPWVVIGWGDRFCYMERGMTAGRVADMARFILTPDNPSVILVDPVESLDAPDILRRRMLKLELSQEGFRRLTERLDSSFAVEDGRLLLMGRGRSPDSWFFRSVETTDVSFTCNHWVADVLSAAGVPVTMPLDIMPYGLAFDLRRGADAEVIRQETIAADYFETPPAYSGAFGALSQPAEAVTGGLRFQAFRIAFDRGQIYDTVPLDLVAADERPTPKAAPYADILDVDPRSLVALRRVAVESRRDASGLCGDDATHELAIGYRYPTDDRPYEVVIAAFRGRPHGAAEPCAVYDYEQL
jgi:Protein of unknown function (DUF2459)